MAAALAVLDLPELLENILLQLDSWKRPFVLVRVSRRFKATIEGSLRLQRKMWLLPSLEDVEFEMNLPCEHKGTTGASAALYNSLLMSWHAESSAVRFSKGCERGVDLQLARELSIEATVYRTKRLSDLRVLSVGDSWRRVLCTQKSGVLLAKLYQGLRNTRTRRILFINADVELAKHATMGDFMEGVERCFDEFLEREKHRSSGR